MVTCMNSSYLAYGDICHHNLTGAEIETGTELGKREEAGE